MVPRPPSNPEGEGTHTYIEGLQFGSNEEEVLAKGGDPFFLNDDGQDENMNLGETNEDEFIVKEAAMPSMAFMSNVASLPNTLDVVGRGSSDATEEDDSTSSNMASASSAESGDIPFGAGGLHSRPEGEGQDFEERKAALEESGGDSFFLEDDEKEDNGGENKEKFDPIDEWDGWAVEDAHLDFE